MLRHLIFGLVLCLATSQAMAEDRIACVVFNDHDQVLMMEFPPESQRDLCDKWQLDEGMMQVQLPLSMFEDGQKIDVHDTQQLLSVTMKVQTFVEAWLRDER